MCVRVVEKDESQGPTSNKTLCPSGLRGWTQVPLAQAAWVRIPQVSIFENFGISGWRSGWMEWEEGGRVPRTPCCRTAYPSPPPPPSDQSVRSLRQGSCPIFFAPLGPLQQLSQKNGVFLIWGPPALFFFSAAWHLPKVLILQSASA